MTQLLLYKTAAPVSRDRHGDCHVEVGTDYAFCQTVNSVPLTAVEFPLAAPEYTIVFTGPEGEIMPAVILGLHGNENLFVSPNDHKWHARYIPAFVRRYPFVFSRNEDRFVLCVDEAYPGLNREGRGQPIFADQGKPSPYVENVLKFLNEYQTHFQRTQAFCNKIKQLNLLSPMQAQVVAGAEGKVSLGGFQAVDRARLKALSGEQLVDLAATDELELLYLHLQSMRNLERLTERMVQARGDVNGTASQGTPG